MESNPRPQHYQVCTGNAADLPEHTKPQVRLSWAAGVAGLAKSTTFRDRGRSVRRRAHDVAVWLRRRNDTAKDEVLAITGQLATLAEATIGEARQVALNARRTLHRRKVAGSGQTRRALAEIDRVAGLLEQVVAQTRTRLGGEVPDGSTRVVSLHDPDARPIRKGRLGRPVEFGYKAQIADNADGLVIDHTVAVGNPPDAPMLAPRSAGSKPGSGGPPNRSPPIEVTARLPSMTPSAISASRRWRSHAAGRPARPARRPKEIAGSSASSSGAPAAKPASPA